MNGNDQPRAMAMLNNDDFVFLMEDPDNGNHIAYGKWRWSITDFPWRRRITQFTSFSKSQIVYNPDADILHTMISINSRARLYDINATIGTTIHTFTPSIECATITSSYLYNQTSVFFSIK